MKRSSLGENARGMCRVRRRFKQRGVKPRVQAMSFAR